MTVKQLEAALKGEKQDVPCRAIDKGSDTRDWRQFRIVRVQSGSFDKDGAIHPCVFLQVEPL